MRPFRPQSLDHAVPEFGDEAALGHRHQAELLDAADLCVVGDGEVLDAVSDVRPGNEALRLLEDVQHDVECRVTDRVSSHLPARAMRAHDLLSQRFLPKLEKSAVAGLAVVIAGHEGTAADQRAVREDLDRAETEPFVTEPGADSQVQPEMFAVRSRAERMKGCEVRHDGGPHMEPAGVSGQLIAGQVHDALAEVVGAPKPGSVMLVMPSESALRLPASTMAATSSTVEAGIWAVTSARAVS